MENNKEEWRRYKSAICEKKSDFSDVFTHIKNQKESSDGWVTGCCAFHDDKHPSFAFNRKTGVWACFTGCGKGSALDFLMQTSGRSFKDVLINLGDQLNVPRPNFNGQKPDQITEEYVKRMTVQLQKNVKVLNYLHNKRGLTDETIHKYQLGWDEQRHRLSIPIRNEKGKLVNIRFYSPSKQPKMLNLKGHGNTPRLYGADELIKFEGKQAVLCEGEFDRLILQQNGFMAVTSTHGCASFREEWIPLFKDKDVIILYDCDPEGQGAALGVVLRAFKNSQVASLKNVKLPLPGTKDDKDVTDFFVKERPVNGNLFEKCRYTTDDLKKLIQETPAIDLRQSDSIPNSEENPAILQIINQFRKSETLKGHERNVAISETVASHLNKRGAFFFDPKTSSEYLCLEGQVYTIGNNRAFNTLLQKIGQLNVTTTEGRFVWEFVKNHARSEGTPIKSVGWVYGDSTKPAIFIHSHNEKGEVIKITSNSIALIPNGQNDDKIMLNPSDRVQPFRYIENVDAIQGWNLFKKLLHETFPCNQADRALLSSIVPLIFFKDFCPAKPLIRLSGSTDSGKTTAEKLIGYLVYGDDIAKTGTIASFYTDASKNPLALIDNLEVTHIKGELLDFLLTGATGIVHEKKKLYTDQEIVREKATSFIMSNGIESLGKPELLSRQWEIVCDMVHHHPKFSQTTCIQEILQNRDILLSIIFQFIAHKILPELTLWKDIELMLKKEFKGHPKDRTFECLALAFLIWDALEELLGIEKDLWMVWLNSQKKDSDETSTETNLILQFLNLFRGAICAFQMSTNPKARDEFLEKYHLLPKDEDDTICFEVSAVELLHIFTTLAKIHGYPRPFENARQLMARLKEARSIVQASGWKVAISFKKVRGQYVHRFVMSDKDERGDSGGGLKE